MDTTKSALMCLLLASSTPRRGAETPHLPSARRIRDARLCWLKYASCSYLDRATVKV